MHQCGSSEELLNSTEVVEDWPGVLWNTVVWPGGEVELSDLQLVPSSLVTLHGDKEHTKIAIAFTAKQHEIFTQHVTATVEVYYCLFLFVFTAGCLFTYLYIVAVTF